MSLYREISIQNPVSPRNKWMAVSCLKKKENLVWKGTRGVHSPPLIQFYIRRTPVFRNLLKMGCRLLVKILPYPYFMYGGTMAQRDEQLT